MTTQIFRLQSTVKRSITLAETSPGWGWITLDGKRRPVVRIGALGGIWVLADQVTEGINHHRRSLSVTVPPGP